MEEKLYIKDGLIRPSSDIIIKNNNSITYNPTEKQLLDNGWLTYIPKPSTVTNNEDKLKYAKKHKIYDIEQYDKSKHVNGFYLNNSLVWLPKNDRVGLMNSTKIEKEKGVSECSLWFEIDNMPFCFKLNCDDIIEMLQRLEIYAKECYNVTKNHKLNVLCLTDKAAVNEYNYKEGYPDKLRFNI